MHLYQVKECLCDIPGARQHPHALDENVQFLRLGQFLSDNNSI